MPYGYSLRKGNYVEMNIDNSLAMSPTWRMKLRIAELRAARGLSQTDLAERLGTTQAAVSRMETGSRDLNTARLEQVARALGVTVADLIIEQYDDHTRAELNRVFSQLTAENRKVLLDVARSMRPRRTE